MRIGRKCALIDGFGSLKRSIGTPRKQQTRFVNRLTLVPSKVSLTQKIVFSIHI
jgi:hypothetical protein